MNIQHHTGSVFASKNPRSTSTLEARSNAQLGTRTSVRRALKLATANNVGKPDQFTSVRSSESIRMSKRSQSRPKRALTKKKSCPAGRSSRRNTKKRISAAKKGLARSFRPRAYIQDESKRSFPVRLFDMLHNVEVQGLSDIVSWQQHGRALRVHNPDRFVTDILPYYFHQSKITSFQRQLNVYGFRRIIYGKDAGSYHHSLFLRGVRPLAFKMERVGIKHLGVRSTYLFAEEEPDFDAMPPINEALIKTLSAQDLDVVKAIQFVNKPIVERLVDMTLDEASAVMPIIPDSNQKANKRMSPAEVFSCGSTPDLEYYDELQQEQDEKEIICGYANDGDAIDFEGKRFYYMDSLSLEDLAASV